MPSQFMFLFEGNMVHKKKMYLKSISRKILP